MKLKTVCPFNKNRLGEPNFCCTSCALYSVGTYGPGCAFYCIAEALDGIEHTLDNRIGAALAGIEYTLDHPQK